VDGNQALRALAMTPIHLSATSEFLKLIELSEVNQKGRDEQTDGILLSASKFLSAHPVPDQRELLFSPVNFRFAL
jgi:hypothetical protein